MIKKIFRVTDMHCPNCAMRIESIEDELTGIQRISASYRSGQVEVVFNEKEVSESEIIDAVEKIGYAILGNAD